MVAEPVRPPATRQKLPDGTIVYPGAGVLRRLAPGVLLLSVQGGSATPGSDGPMQDFDAEIQQHGKLTLFLDLSNRKSVSSSSREGWVGWTRKNQGRLTTHVLVKSKLVEMALSVIGMLAGGIKMKSYSDVREFEAAIAREVPGFHHLPPLP